MRQIQIEFQIVAIFQAKYASRLKPLSPLLIALHEILKMCWTAQPGPDGGRLRHHKRRSQNERVLEGHVKRAF